MSFLLPASVRRACQDYAAGLPRSEIALRAAAMSERYRAGRPSHEAIASTQDVAAYLLARLPATYAAVSAAVSAAARLVPSFEPKTLLDLCAGPGTASMAALEQWPSLGELTLVDANPLLLAAAKRLAQACAMAAFGEARLIPSTLGAAMDGLPGADLVIMSYALV
jgi:ribosomal protein RSM22 (predicted rRNA methylase)